MSNLFVTGTGCFEGETKEIYNEIQVALRFYGCTLFKFEKNISNIIFENSLFIYTSVISVAKKILQL